MRFRRSVLFPKPVFPTTYKCCARSSGCSKTSFGSSETQKVRVPIAMGSGPLDKKTPDLSSPPHGEPVSSA